jgi:hypothetical protein
MNSLDFSTLILVTKTHRVAPVLSAIVKYV